MKAHQNLLGYVIIFPCLLLLLAACLHTTKTGFLVIRNDTSFPISGKSRYAHEQELKDEFYLEAGNEYVVDQYEAKPDDKDAVLKQFVELLVSKDNCKITLDNTGMKQHTSYKGVSATIHITEKVFAQCK